jgi:hypothetical protein
MKQKLLAIGSIACPAIFLAEIVLIFLIAQHVDPDALIPRHLLPWVVVGMLLLLASVIGVWFYIIYFMIHAIKSPALSNGTKAAWICGLWFLNVFVIPIYWFVHMRNDGSKL